MNEKKKIEELLACSERDLGKKITLEMARSQAKEARNKIKLILKQKEITAENIEEVKELNERKSVFEKYGMGRNIRNAALYFFISVVVGIILAFMVDEFLCMSPTSIIYERYYRDYVWNYIFPLYAVFVIVIFFIYKYIENRKK